MTTTARGVILAIRQQTLLVTVMPASAPPYRARINRPADAAQSTVLRVGSHVELLIGDDPNDVHLATEWYEPPPAA